MAKTTLLTSQSSMASLGSLERTTPESLPSLMLHCLDCLIQLRKVNEKMSTSLIKIKRRQSVVLKLELEIRHTKLPEPWREQEHRLRQT